MRDFLMDAIEDVAKRPPGDASKPDTRDSIRAEIEATAERLQPEPGAPMGILEIIESGLEKNGFDGLFNGDIECGCKRGDLSPRGCLDESCEPGFLDLTGCGTECTVEHEFHIVPKPTPTPAETP